MKVAIALPPPPRTAPLARAVFAQVRAKVTGQEVETVVKAMPRGDDVMRVINEADPGVATTGGSHYVSDLQQTTYGEFLSWLAPGSAAAQLMPMGLVVPFRGGTFKAPGRDTAPAALPWVGESNPIPVRSATLLGVTLSPRKMGAMSIISREAARFGGESAITTLLREDGAKGVDAGYFSTAAGDTVTHAGLLAGLSPITGYAGGDEVAFVEDIGALLAAVAPNGSDNLVLVTGQFTAQRIALKFPLFKMLVLPSQAVADTRLIMVDAGSLVHSFGDFDIEISFDAAVHMEDTAPAEIGGTTAPVRSLFQTDAMGVRILGDIAFAGRRSGVAAYVDGVTW